MQVIVLTRRDFREFDQIISCYSLDKGKIDLLARGVKKITSKNSAQLEPFSYVDVEIIFGKELAHLGTVQPINYFVNIRQNLQKSLAAAYLVMFLNKLVEIGEHDKKIFDILLSWLEFVNQVEKFNLVLSDAFIVKLLFLLGFDITQADELTSELEKDLEMLNNGEWRLINQLKFEDGEYQKLHNFIYKFTVFQTEKDFKNWLNLAKSC